MYLRLSQDKGFDVKSRFGAHFGIEEHSPAINTGGKVTVCFRSPDLASRLLHPGRYLSDRNLHQFKVVLHSFLKAPPYFCTHLETLTLRFRSRQGTSFLP